MIESSSQNVQLSFEQLQQLSTFQNQLSKLDGDIAASNKNLLQLRLETENIIKEKGYQQGLLDDLTSEVAQLQTTKELLDNTIASAELTVQDSMVKAEALRIDYGNHISLMAQEKNDLNIKKESHAKEWQGIVAQKEEVALSQKKVEAARQILDSAVKSIRLGN